MHIIRRYLLIATALLAAACASAQEGATSYGYLNIPLSTRIYGLGGMNITLVDDDVTTVEQNPALLGSEMSGQAAIGYMRYVGESNFAGVRYAHSAGSHGSWSAAINYFNYGDIKEADEAGNLTGGNISPKDAVFMLAYSHDISDNLRGGINIKGASSTYAEYSAFALATDIGINYFNPETDLSVSMVLANLGGQVKKFNNNYEKLPFDVRLGMSKSFGTLPIRFSVTAWNLTKWRLPYYEYGDGTVNSEPKEKDSFSSNLFRHLVFGADLISSPNWYLGLGYNYRVRTDMQNYHRSMISGFSLSGGIRVSNFGVGIAFSQPHTGATTFMLNLTANLSEIL